MKKVIIYGASGHSKMIIDIIHKTNSYDIVGLMDLYKTDGECVYGYDIIGDLDNLNDLIHTHDIYGVVIGIGDNYTRKMAHEAISKIAPEINFVPIIHPSAIIAEDVEVTKGTVIMAGAIINAGAKIGKFCIINTKASLGHDSEMSNYSSLASGATVGGNVSIGTCSAICLSASIINNVAIGDHTVIGSGALVISSIGNFKQAIGVPINSIKERKIDSKYLERHS
jgi:sugar O-acyltransferase (sialic acid O-acetyltransferase NeuD family)